MSNITKLLTQAAAGGEEEVRGERLFLGQPGSVSYTVPTGVTSISVVAIGAGGGSRVGYNANDNTITGGAGGGLAYQNNIAVTPGETLTVVAGESNPGNGAGGSSSLSRGGTKLVEAQGGQFGTGGNGGTSLGYDGGGDGGDSVDFVGGGAGGYSGNGGDQNASGAGGGGAGGGGPISPDTGGGGGGVGAHGEGTSGTSDSEGGSGGSDGGTPSDTGQSGGVPHGGTFGGGAGGYKSGGNNFGAAGGIGCVRIVYPGDTRQFPDTDVDGDFPS